MNRNLLAFALIFSFFYSGCFEGNSLTPDDISTTGSAQISIGLGKVGTLAKLSSIELKTLEVILTAKEETPVIRQVTVGGNIEQNVDISVEGLASLKTWTIKARTVDEKETVIHEGQTSFYVKPLQTAVVNFSMEAIYSMLKAEFMEIPDSVTVLELVVNGAVKDVERAEKSYLTGTKAVLSYDYLEAGKKHEIVLNVYGSMWNEKAILYSGKVEVAANPGEDKGYEVDLDWVGPDAPPKGKATIKVVLGQVGTATVKAKFEKHKKNYAEEYPE